MPNQDYNFYQASKLKITVLQDPSGINLIEAQNMDCISPSCQVYDSSLEILFNISFSSRLILPSVKFTINGKRYS